MSTSLREMRRRKLLTQQELATAIGVAYQSIQRWEAGTSKPRPAALRKLCEALQVTPDELLAALDAGEQVADGENGEA